MIDLRSDTVTRPTPGMRKAMADAVVGDDVFGEDPTVRALEEEVADLTGKEAALFVTSGTMGNQLAIACLTRPGDEVILGEDAHVAFYEVGASAALSGVQFVTAGRGGFFSEGDMLERVKPDAYFYPRTSLVTLENTHNRAGGKVWEPSAAAGVARAAKARGIASHLDGARLWNASLACGHSVADLAGPFDTVSVCFSKGLGAPVGSALAATKDLVRAARRRRKMWGGGMRQAGILAAGALYALTHHRSRLVDDHAHARLFAAAIRDADVATVDLASVVTNIVNVDLPLSIPADDVVRVARELGALVNATGPGRLRVVTHLDVSREDAVLAADRLVRAIRQVHANTLKAP